MAGEAANASVLRTSRIAVVVCPGRPTAPLRAGRAGAANGSSRTMVLAT
jgi:hypothetical protein